MNEEERKAVVEKAMDICAELRDEKHPDSWTDAFRQGFVWGCDNCVSQIHNVLMYEKAK